MRPTRRFLFILGAGLPLTLLPLVFGNVWSMVWLVFMGGLALAFVGDVLLCPTPRRFAARLETPNEIVVGEESDFHVHVATQDGLGPWPVRIVLNLEEPLPPVLSERLVAGPEEESATFTVQPPRRGRPIVGPLALVWRGRWGLIRRVNRDAELQRTVTISPDITAAHQAALKFFDPRTSHTGLKVERFLGDGSEFDALREYQPGFDQRSIDWKASARHRALLSREFRAERNHQIVVAVDTGHLMSEPLDGKRRIDHAVAAGLALSYVALKTGDLVTTFAFDEKVRLMRPAGRGPAAAARLRHSFGELDAHPTETNFTLGLTALMQHLRRRALVVVVTEFVDTVTAELMIDNLKRLAGRHLVLFVTFADHELEGIVDDQPRHLDDVHRAVVARELVDERRIVLERLTRSGIHCLEVAPTELSTKVLNRYLEIKRREMV